MIWQFIIALVINIVFKLLLASKDADSYLLKSKTDNSLTSTRINRWHRTGAAIDVVFSLVLSYAGWSLWIIPQSLLVRLTIFDIAFNKYASLSLTQLGSTAWVDKQFVKIFGINGAVKKSMVFAILTLILTVYVTWF